MKRILVFLLLSVCVLALNFDSEMEDLESDEDYSDDNDMASDFSDENLSDDDEDDENEDENHTSLEQYHVLGYPAAAYPWSPPVAPIAPVSEPVVAHFLHPDYDTGLDYGLDKFARQVYGMSPAQEPVAKTEPILPTDHISTEPAQDEPDILPQKADILPQKTDDIQKTDVLPQGPQKDDILPHNVIKARVEPDSEDEEIERAISQLEKSKKVLQKKEKSDLVDLQLEQKKVKRADALLMKHKAKLNKVEAAIKKVKGTTKATEAKKDVVAAKVRKDKKKIKTAKKQAKVISKDPMLPSSRKHKLLKRLAEKVEKYLKKKAKHLAQLRSILDALMQ